MKGEDMMDELFEAVSEPMSIVCRARRFGPWAGTVSDDVLH